MFPAPGDQAAVTKYSVVYFLRPGDDVLLKRLRGGDVIPEAGEGETEEDALTSKEWVLRRALGRLVGTSAKEGLGEAKSVVTWS